MKRSYVVTIDLPEGISNADAHKHIVEAVGAYVGPDYPYSHWRRDFFGKALPLDFTVRRLHAAQKQVPKTAYYK